MHPHMPTYFARIIDAEYERNKLSFEISENNCLLCMLYHGFHALWLMLDDH